MIYDEAKPFSMDDFLAAVEQIRNAPPRPPQPIIVSPSAYRTLRKVYWTQVMWRHVDFNRLIAPRLTRFLVACRRARFKARMWWLNRRRKDW